MTICSISSKGKNVFQLKSDDGSWIANFDSLAMAAAALRYLSGCVMNNREKVIALAALENNKDGSDNGSA